jgi:hypothetical protein
MRPHLRRRVSVAIALNAAALAIIGAVAIAGSGSAHGAPKTLHLLAKAQKGIGFAPDGKPRQGDGFGGGAKISGDDTGFSRTVCTVIGKGALCNLQLKLSKGQLSVQGLVPQRADHTPMAIIGGTGAHSGARGTAIATQISQTRTRLTVRLRP